MQDLTKHVNDCFFLISRNKSFSFLFVLALLMLLYQELGFEGVAVSDWEEVIRLHTRDLCASITPSAKRLNANIAVLLS
jgi:hypothetical protein